MDDVTKLIRTELSVVGCNVVLTRCLSGIFPPGDALGVHGGVGLGYADNSEGASSYLG